MAIGPFTIQIYSRPAFVLSFLDLSMAARLAYSRIAPAFVHARVTASLATRRALVRGYASSSEHSASLRV